MQRRVMRPIASSRPGRSLIGAAATVVVTISLTGCATRATPGTIPSLTCTVADSALVRETLYFGRNRPGGGVVTDGEWQNFLEQVLTPRFPAGLTVVDATGQWRGRSGAIEQERSHIVTVFHAGDDVSRTAIREVAQEYKRRFQQEAVLRERVPTCTAFE